VAFVLCEPYEHLWLWWSHDKCANLSAAYSTFLLWEICDIIIWFYMDNYKSWKIMNWNLRGINSEKKWVALSNKIEESGCDIICLQETKRESFDLAYIKKNCPKKFTRFEFVPSVGASGGLIIILNGSLFKGEMAFHNEFSLSVKFQCNLSNDSWILTNIYGPCQSERKSIIY
jgi:hypothetical protein